MQAVAGAIVLLCQQVNQGERWTPVHIGGIIKRAETMPTFQGRPTSFIITAIIEMKNKGFLDAPYRLDNSTRVWVMADLVVLLMLRKTPSAAP